MFDLKKQRLLIIAPHPDDEVLGCGGFIKKIKDHGGKVYVLFLTVAQTQDFSRTGYSSAEQRNYEIEKVAKFLQFDDYHIAFEGDKFHLKLDILGQHQLINLIERNSTVSFERIKPTILAFPAPTSYNQDHQIAAKAAHAAARPAETETKHFISTVLSYEMPADSWRLSNQIEPNFFVPLTKKEVEAKLAALKLYKSQLRPSPNPRSPEIVKTLSLLRGSSCGHQYAEAFISYRYIT